MNPFGSYQYDASMEGGTANFQSAAIYVAIMIATAAVVLALLKRSGFRAMIAVGPRG